MNRGQVKLLLIAAVFATPVALSYATYYFWKPAKIGNFGELLNPPVVLGDFVVRDEAGKTFAMKALGGKWLILHSDSGHCEAACLKKLQAMRRVHVALGKNQERVRRIALIDDGKPRDPTHHDGAEGLVWLDATGSELQKKLPALNSTRNHIYLVDPLGNLFMRYSVDAEVKGIIKDLERVLKASKIG